MKKKLTKTPEERKNGYQYSSINPGWIKRNRVPQEFADDDLKRIVLFYVINTPCESLSSSSIPLQQYGWPKSVWQNNLLKDKLFSIANLKRNESFFVTKYLYDMKDACQKAKLTNSFQEHREAEKITLYKPANYPEFMAVFLHIRNAFAHGRLAMYKQEADIIFVLEDGLKKGDKFQVRSRMILKKSTLLEWINIIERGPNLLCTG